MTIHNFITQFPDEETCRNHFKKVREKNGITCKKCQHSEHSWLSKKWQWQCKQCRFRTTLRSGTSMQWAKISFFDWYLCMALMTATKKGVSCKEMQRLLGHTRYQTTWELMQKIRASMFRRDAPMSIDDVVQSDLEKFRTLPPTKSSKPGSIRTTYMESRSTEPFISEQISQSSTSKEHGKKVLWIADQHCLVPGFSYFFNTYMTTNDDLEKKSVDQNWVNILAYNAKKSIFGIHHKVSTKYLQFYLSEFCFKLNRRELNANRFDSLINAISKKFGGTLPDMRLHYIRFQQFSMQK